MLLFSTAVWPVPVDLLRIEFKGVLFKWENVALVRDSSKARNIQITILLIL